MRMNQPILGYPMFKPIRVPQLPKIQTWIIDTIMNGQLVDTTIDIYWSINHNSRYSSYPAVCKLTVTMVAMVAVSSEVQRFRHFDRTFWLGSEAFTTSTTGFSHNLPPEASGGSSARLRVAINQTTIWSWVSCRNKEYTYYIIIYVYIYIEIDSYIHLTIYIYIY